jgi:hypothetical protein
MANLNDWVAREPMISRALFNYMKFTKAPSVHPRSVQLASGSYLYPEYTLESDLFFFWGLIVQISECWDVAGVNVSAAFDEIYANPLMAIALQDLYNAIFPQGDEYSSVLGFYTYGHGLEKCSLPDKEKHFHMLRTLRNSFGHARFAYKSDKLSNLLAACDPPLNFGDFHPAMTLIPDQDPTKEKEAYLVVLTDSVPGNQNSLRVIIAKQSQFRYHLFEFLTAVLRVAHCADVFNS